MGGVINIYALLPQHFLYFRPLPQVQGSLRPIFGTALVNGLCGGGQQLVFVQLDSSATEDVSDKLLLLSLMSTTNSLFKLKH
jgi:hypothetical protein